MRIAEPDGQDVRRFHFSGGVPPPSLGDHPFREGVGRIGRCRGQPDGAEDHPGQGLKFRVPLARLEEHDRQQQPLVPHQPDLRPLPFTFVRFAEQALESIRGTFQSNVFPGDVQRLGAGQSGGVGQQRRQVQFRRRRCIRTRRKAQAVERQLGLILRRMEDEPLIAPLDLPGRGMRKRSTSRNR